MARIRKKKKISTRTTPISPTKYVMTRAKSLPLHKCFINPSWKIAREASVIVTRRHVTGHVTAGIYLVDLLAYGVKDTLFVFNQPEQEFFSYLRDLNPDDPMEEIPYVLAHNIVYGALAFAEDYDFKPHKDFSITEHILEEDTDDIELFDIEFGIEGKPGFVDSIF